MTAQENPGGWPDAALPGYPLNHEMDSDGHVIRLVDYATIEVYRWVAAELIYRNKHDQWVSPIDLVADGDIYLGRIVSPSEVAALVEAARVEAAEGMRWQPIETAPKNATNVLLRFPAQGFNRQQMVVAHWAHGGGDDQPAFGPGWFKANLGRRGELLGFCEVSATPDAWAPLPTTQRAGGEDGK